MAPWGFKEAGEQGYTVSARRKGLMDFSSSFSHSRPLFPPPGASNRKSIGAFLSQSTSSFRHRPSYFNFKFNNKKLSFTQLSPLRNQSL
jgi:hypothetical protein